LHLHKITELLCNSVSFIAIFNTTVLDIQTSNDYVLNLKKSDQYKEELNRKNVFSVSCEVFINSTCFVSVQRPALNRTINWHKTRQVRKSVRTRIKAKGKRGRHPDKLQSTSRLDGNLRLTYKQQLMSKNVKKLKSDEPGKNIRSVSNGKQWKREYRVS